MNLTNATAGLSETEVKTEKSSDQTNHLELSFAVYLKQISDLKEMNRVLIEQLQNVKQEMAAATTAVNKLISIKDASTEDEGKNSMAERPLSGIKVLVAEDSPDNQMLMRQYLGIAGAEVDIVENGEEVIAMALENRHHLILMDVMMPVCDGYEATRALREKGYKKPIIALTAHALKEQREQSFREGCNEHLVKPINRPLLISTIARFAGQNEA